MAEEGKTLSGLNLGSKATQVDQNSRTKTDNTDQAPVSAPRQGDDSKTADTGDGPAPVVEGASDDLNSSESTGGENEGEFATQSGETTDSANDVLAEASAIRAVSNNVGGAPQEGETVYTSHPVSNFRFGRFQFENATLRLSGKDADEFDKLLNHENTPPSTRAAVRKLDASRVERIIDERRQATQQFDSSLGREALERLHLAQPTVGRQDITHEKLAQMDNNMPTVPTPPLDTENETGVDLGAKTKAGDEA